MKPKQHATLGLFFLGVVGVLAWFTLFQSDFRVGGETRVATVWLEDAGGLRSGDPVLVAGVRWGKVDGVRYDARTEDLARRIQVDLVLDQDVTLFADHRIEVKDATVLGGKNLSIEPGSPGSGTYAGEWLGSTKPDVLAALGEVLDENRSSLRNTIAGLETMVGDVNSGKGVLGALISDEGLRDSLDAAVANVEATFADLSKVATQVSSGEGTLGKLLFDQALAQQIGSAVENVDGLLAEARTAIEDARAGKGALGTLLVDEAFAENLRTTLDDLATTTDRLAKGEGTIGRLLTDPKIADDLAVITDALAKGEGTLGRLILEPAVYEDLAAISADLRTFSSALVSGEGTISRLVYDDALYQEIDRSLRVLTGTLEEAREAAPITTFLNAVFVGF
jgi:phospholipid/cholesterol/gamma-HCH transport system substrate-binding protein